MNNFTNSILFRARWNIIDEVKQELEHLDHECERGPKCFAVGNLEFISIALPIAGSVVVALTGIIVAWVNRGKKIRIVFDGDKIKEIDASNFDAEEIMTTIQKIKAMDIID